MLLLRIIYFYEWDEGVAVMLKKKELYHLGHNLEEKYNTSLTFYELNQQDLEKFAPIGEVFSERGFYISYSSALNTIYIKSSKQWVDKKMFLSLLKNEDQCFNKVFSLFNELSYDAQGKRKEGCWLFFLNPYNDLKYIYSVKNGITMYSIKAID